MTISPEERLQRAFSRGSPFEDTFEANIRGGIMSSFGLGTALRTLTAPGLLTDKPQRGDTPESYATRVQTFQRNALTEDQYKTSPYFRDAVPWERGMTEDRAAVLAGWYDEQQKAAFLMGRNPLAGFAGQLVGQLPDPVNYIPVFGPAAHAAAVAKAGSIFGRAGMAAAEAAVNTAAFGLLTAGIRRSYGDEVSFEAIATEIGMSALIGGAFGAGIGVLARGQDVRVKNAVSSAKASMDVLKRKISARDTLRKAAGDIATKGYVDLGKKETAPMVEVAREIDQRMASTRALDKETSGVVGEKPGQVVYSPDGAKVAVRPEIVEADSLQHAFGALQVRDRSRVDSDRWVETTAADLKPEWLKPELSSDRGAPVVGEDNIVDSGNGRTMAIKRAYEAHPEKAQAYKDSLVADGYNIDGFEKPVLISRRLTPLSPEARSAFNAQSNSPTTAEMSATEIANMDAMAMDDDVLAIVGDGPVNSPTNRQFVSAFLGRLPKNARGRLTDASGNLNRAGVERIENALTSIAYGSADPLVMRRFAEATDDNSRTILGAMADVAATWARIARLVKKGEIDPAFDPAPTLTDAVRRLNSWRAQAASEKRPVSQVIKEGMAQLDLLGGDLALPTRRMIEAFYSTDDFTKAIGRDVLATYLNRIAANVEELGQPQLFGRPGVTMEEVISHATADGQSDIFVPASALGIGPANGAIDRLVSDGAGGEADGGRYDQTGTEAPAGAQVGFAEFGGVRGASRTEEGRLALHRFYDMENEGTHGRVEMFRETGFFRGVDGKPRFEISDKDATVKSGEVSWHNVEDTQDPFAKANLMQAPAEVQRDAVFIGDDRIVQLYQVLDHPKLYEAYPQLQDIPVQLAMAPHGGIPRQGVWDGHFITAQADNWENLRSVLLHEVQHAIQLHENHAYGGNPKMGEIYEGENVANWTREVDAAKAAVTKLEDDLIAGRLDSDGQLQLDAANKKVHETILGLKRAAQYEYYQRIAGEVEARNVQGRAEMLLGGGKSESMLPPPWYTADRPEDMQNVIMARGDAFAAMSMDSPDKLVDGMPLPEDQARYFLPDPKSRDIPLDQIDSQARGKSAQTAAQLMMKAYNGEGGKRAAVELKALPDGRFEARDGNSTIEAARANGWDNIRGRVMTDAEFDAMKMIKQARQEADKMLPVVGQPGTVADLRSVPDLARQEYEWTWRTMQPAETMDEVFAVADKWQGELTSTIAALRDELGLEQPVKIAKRKERLTTEQKMIRKGYATVKQLTDVVRDGVAVVTPDQADAIIKSLGKKWNVLDEGWYVTEAGYFDRKALVQFPDGTLGELQFYHPEVLRAKKTGGHHMYEEWRNPATAPERKAELLPLMREVYASALRNASPEWKSIVGEIQTETFGGNPAMGNTALNLSTDSRLPLSMTSDGSTLTQSLDSTAQPSAPSRSTTAGRPSQSKNQMDMGQNVAIDENFINGLAEEEVQFAFDLSVMLPKTGLEGKAAADAIAKMDKIVPGWGVIHKGSSATDPTQFAPPPPKTPGNNPLERSYAREIDGRHVEFEDEYQAELFDLGDQLLGLNKVSIDQALAGDFPSIRLGKNLDEAIRLYSVMGNYVDPPARNLGDIGRAAMQHAAAEHDAGSSGARVAESVIDHDLKDAWTRFTTRERRDMPRFDAISRDGFDPIKVQPDTVPEGLAEAEASIGKPEDIKQMQENFGIRDDGKFDELDEIDQLAEDGHLTPEDEADLASAERDYKNASAYGRALKAALACIL